MHEDVTAAAPSPLRVKRTEAILRVTLDRPDRANSLDSDIVARFLALFDDTAHIADIRALVIAGSGDNFCGGFDLSNIESQDEAALVLRFLRIETLLQRLYHAPFATIACAHGNAIGAGADIFAACAYRIAEAGTRFRMPGWQFGIALGTRRLADRVGAARAHDMLGANRTLAGPEALACGLATHVAERSRWPSIIAEIVATIRPLPADAREALRALTIDDHRDADMAALVRSALHGPGLKERIVAYVRAGRERRHEAAEE